MLGVHLWIRQTPVLLDLLLNVCPFGSISQEWPWDHSSEAIVMLIKNSNSRTHSRPPEEKEFVRMESWNLHFFKLPWRFLQKLKYKNCFKEWRTIAKEVLSPPYSLAQELVDLLLVRPFKDLFSGDSLPSRYTGLEGIWILGFRTPRKLSCHQQASRSHVFCQDYLCPGLVFF